MTDFCIQIHPDRAPALDLQAVCACAADFAAASPLVTRFAQVPGEGYLNLMFATAAPAALWPALSSALFAQAEWGQALRSCAMAMCEGRAGWDDCLLLHHFDGAQALDSLA